MVGNKHNKVFSTQREFYKRYSNNTGKWTPESMKEGFLKKMMIITITVIKNGFHRQDFWLLTPNSN